MRPAAAADRLATIALRISPVCREMGAGGALCFEEVHGRRPREGADAAGTDRRRGRVGRARRRGPRRRADRSRPFLRLRRPPERRRSRALRTCDERPSRLPRPLHRRRLLAGSGAAAPQARALRERRRAQGLDPHRRAHRGAKALPRRARRRQAAGGGRPRWGRDRRHPVRRDRARQSHLRGVDMSQEIIEALREIEREKGIESGTLVKALEDALLAAYKKTPGAARHASVDLDDGGDFRVFSVELPADIEERLIEEARERAIEELERLEAENGERSHTLVNDDDLDIDWSDVAPAVVKRADVTPHDFGRIAAQTAMQVILQRVGEVVTGIVQQAGDRNNVLIDLGRVEALLPRSEQVDGERYEQGSRIKAVITEVRSGTKGPQVILSRRDPELIKTLFELEVPEIADGLVEIRGVAREPGYRSKIAVESHVQGVDPVGACVGPRGSRVRMVVSELRGEKIDIIPWNPEPARFVAKALSPARVREVLVDDESSEATVVVPDDQLSLAIGKEGLNARLAARLTGWKIDIQSETEFARAEADAAFGGQEEEFSGRCVALLSTGKRCPNTALPGSHYCGISAHREIAEREAAGEDVTAEIVQPAQPESDEPEAGEVEEVEATDAVEEPAAETAPAAEAVGEAKPAPEPEPEPEPEAQTEPEKQEEATPAE